MGEESDLEVKFWRRAEALGWFTFKIMQANKRGVPDRFFARAGRLVFIEVKRFGKDATLQQALRHQEMRDHGCEVYCVDNLEEALAILAA